ncbi:MAG: hypothetical protein GY946_11760 [bacterium]|nr:hypothetical protein [bacterium]
MAKDAFGMWDYSFDAAELSEIEPHLIGGCAIKGVVLLPLTVLLTGDDLDSTRMGWHGADGSLQLHETLRDPAVHQGDDHEATNYIRDQWKLANEQLWASGSRVGIDLQDIICVVVPNTILNRWMIGDGPDEISEIIQDLADASTQDPNPYVNRVLDIRRWGRDVETDEKHETSRTRPTGAGSSGLAMPGLMLGSACARHGIPNTTPTHEFGHFMGVNHTFNALREKIQKEWTAVKDGVRTRVEGLERANDLIRGWTKPYDGDASPPQIPYLPVLDTPIDLGDEYSRLLGDTDVCRPREEWVVELNDGTTATIPVDRVRRNIMGYWACYGERERFSDDQVARIHHVAEIERAGLQRRSAWICTAGDVPVVPGPRWPVPWWVWALQSDVWWKAPVRLLARLLYGRRRRDLVRAPDFLSRQVDRRYREPDPFDDVEFKCREGR